MTVQVQVNPEKIMQVGMGFWASKVLLAANELDLFTLLSSGPKEVKQIQDALGLHDRGIFDFLDTLTSLGFLEREGVLESAIYSNAPDVDVFLVKGRPAYLGGMLSMANNRLYKFWGSLEEALKTGAPQNETKFSDKPVFEEIYKDQASLHEFLGAMSSIQMGNFLALAKKFDFSPYQTLCDVGGANGSCSIVIAQHHPHIECTTFDLPPVEAVANGNITAMGLQDRIKASSGDFFVDDLPETDVICMGNILHDWSEEQKLILLEKAYASLPEGGVLIAIENIIDSERRQNAFGLMMSLNMLIETPEGFDYTAADFNRWATKAGFKRTEILPLAGPTSAAIAYK
ncbi:MAG: methyltransferase [Saprospiraceae bacterium]|nr:methyltransferase [Saprospiraceae bacterium]